MPKDLNSEWLIEGFQEACNKNYIHVINYLLASGKQILTNLTYSLQRTCKFNDAQIANILIEYADRHHVLIDWNQVLESACVSGNLSLVQRIISHGANDSKSCFTSACSSGNIELVKLILSHGVIPNENNICEIFSYGLIDVINLLINLVPKFTITHSTHLQACGHAINIARLLIERDILSSSMMHDHRFYRLLNTGISTTLVDNRKYPYMAKRSQVIVQLMFTLKNKLSGHLVRHLIGPWVGY
jgi:hypothetical protein